MYSAQDEDDEISRLDPDDETEYIGTSRLIAIIGDEDTCCGFVLGGIGQADEYGMPNYFVVDPKTDFFKLEKVFLNFIRRKDIGLVLITKEAAEKISPTVKAYKGLDPAVMIIPGHNGPYELDLPPAVLELETRRRSSAGNSRRGSAASATSLKTNQSHGAISPRSSAHSIKSAKSMGNY